MQMRPHTCRCVQMCANKRIQERFLRKENVTSEELVKSCLTAELTSKQVNTIQTAQDKEESIGIDFIKEKKKYKKQYDVIMQVVNLKVLITI